jgi:aerobic-type carbon monoxide dehydrogenase small subunit (CoxS/CutS family)
MNKVANHNSQPVRRLNLSLRRGRRVTFSYNGQTVTAYEGETFATALIAAGHWVFQRTAKSAASRGVHCNIGVCHPCLIILDGKRNVRACQTPVSEGCQVKTQEYEGRERDETI